MGKNKRNYKEVLIESLINSLVYLVVIGGVGLLITHLLTGFLTPSVKLKIDCYEEDGILKIYFSNEGRVVAKNFNAIITFEETFPILNNEYFQTPSIGIEQQYEDLCNYSFFTKGVRLKCESLPSTEDIFLTIKTDNKLTKIVSWADNSPTAKLEKKSYKRSSNEKRRC